MKSINFKVINIIIISFIVMISFSWSQDSTQISNTQETEANKSVVADSLKPDSLVTTDSTQAEAVNLLENVDILGDNSIHSMYIFWDNFTADMYTEVKKSIDNKKFATNHFFMQNIDREEFEQERILLLFEDRKKNFHNLFGDNLNDLIADEED